tara:strand:- start:285 stop:488 length:204 start_codon:yes stop_codon:yes gene_type:complete
MKLQEVDFYLDWPRSIKVINLRKFIIVNLKKKGKVIRWSIVDIKVSLDSPNINKVKINAVLANTLNS